MGRGPRRRRARAPGSWSSCRWRSTSDAAAVLRSPLRWSLLGRSGGVRRSPRTTARRRSPAEDLPPDLLDPNPGSSTTLPGVGRHDDRSSVYLLEETADGVRLVAVDREVADEPASRTSGSRRCFGGSRPRTEVGRRDHAPRIPADTVLLDVTTDEETGEVVIDLSERHLHDRGRGAGPGVRPDRVDRHRARRRRLPQVRFLVDGEPTRVLDGDGAEQDGAVTRRDYSSCPAPLTVGTATRRTPGPRRRARGRPASARPPPPTSGTRTTWPAWRATIVPHAPSCTASMAATPNREASTRSKAVGVPPRCTWPSVVTRVS